MIKPVQRNITSHMVVLTWFDVCCTFGLNENKYFMVLLFTYLLPSTLRSGSTCLIRVEPWDRRWQRCWKWEAMAQKEPVEKSKNGKIKAKEYTWQLWEIYEMSLHWLLSWYVSYLKGIGQVFLKSGCMWYLSMVSGDGGLENQQGNQN